MRAILLSRLKRDCRKTLAELHPGLHYISSSADGVVSGHGPYQAKPLIEYFSKPDLKFHSEIGMPNIPPMESVRAMMPRGAMWPQALCWGLHDFCLEGAMNADNYRALIENSYGGASNVEDWVSLAQFINYDGYRAIFEAQSQHRMGRLLWMSHSSWPSFVWQTYDYYFEPTSAYFGCKKASEPLHIQWNRHTDKIEVVNYSAGDVKGVSAQAEVLNMDGSVMWKKSVLLDSVEDSATACMAMEYPAGLSAVHFIRLTLVRDNIAISNNTYMRGVDEGDYRSIRQLAAARLQHKTCVAQEGDRWRLTTQLKNTSPWPALMVRLKAVRERSGDSILPAIYSDNYVTLMPGEERVFNTELRDADTRGEKPRIEVEGFNTQGVRSNS